MELLELVSITLLTVAQISLPVVILPLELERRRIDLSLTWIAITFYSVRIIAGVVISLKSLLGYLGRRCTSQCGLILIAYCILITSLCFYIPDLETTPFLCASIFFRLIESVITGISMPELLSLLVLWYPNKTGKVISATSLGAYTGMGLAVLVGNTLYHLMDYFSALLILSILTMFTSLLLGLFDEFRGDAIRIEEREPRLTFILYLSIP